MYTEPLTPIFDLVLLSREHCEPNPKLQLPVLNSDIEDETQNQVSLSSNGPLEKLSISFAMAQSIKLSVLELRVEVVVKPALMNV